MKKFLVSAILAVSALSVSAQQQDVKTFAVEPHLGIGYSTLSNYGDVDGGLSMDFGADLSYKFSDKFAASYGLGYYVLQSDEVNSIHDTFSYLDMPILAHYCFNNNFSAFAGFRFAFNLDAERDFDGTKKDLEGVESTHIMLPIGLKYSFNSNWTISAQYNFSLSKINEYGNDDCHLSPIMLNVGYRFDL